MVVYNVTIKVEWAIHEEWLQWMKNEHIPMMIKTGCFFDWRILKLLETDEQDGPTYAFQYHASTVEDYKKYIQSHASTLRQHTFQRWGDQTIALRSVMEVLH